MRYLIIVSAVLCLGLSTSRLNREASAESWWFLAIGLGGSLLAVAWAHARFRPTRRLKRLARKYRKNLKRRGSERTSLLKDERDQALCELEQLRRLDRTKSELFINFSHELRTPLTLALVPIQDLRQGLFGELDASVDEQLALAQQGSERLLELVNQLLDVAKLESDQWQIRPAPVDVDELLGRTVQSLSSLAERDGIELRHEPSRCAQPNSDAPSLKLPSLEEPRAPSADQAFVDRVWELIGNHFADEAFNVEKLAQALAMDRSHLYRKLQALVGRSPSDLIRTLRLQHAERLLQSGSGTVSDIAFRVGFRSVSQFSHTFRRAYGVPPSSYLTGVTALPSPEALSSEAGGPVSISKRISPLP